jgi:peptidoglycan/LPS O-acetylase OafA/YrhL
VTAVAWSHWLPAWQFGLPLGAGVHLFFVLSGFLITRILLGLREAAPRLPAIGRFYARRVLRLVPAFALVFAAALWADVPLGRDTWGWHASYLSNLFIAREARWQGHFSHFWSLAVEEQFYLVWPWLVVLAPSRWLASIVAGSVLLGPLTRLAAADRGLAEPFWALVPGGSGDSLGVGAWLALSTWRAGPAATPLIGRGTMAAVALVLWATMAIAEAFAPLPAALTVWRQAVQAVVFGWVVWRAVAGFGGPAGAILAQPAVVGLGRISYGVYLIHAFAPVVVHGVAGALDGEALMPVAPLPRAGLYATTTVVLAALMWRWVERPLLALKARVPYRTD